VIQCNISNKHGYIFTNAYINVYSQYCTVFSQSSTCLLCTINTITRDESRGFVGNGEPSPSETKNFLKQFLYGGG